MSLIMLILTQHPVQPRALYTGMTHALFCRSLVIKNIYNFILKLALIFDNMVLLPKSVGLYERRVLKITI